MEERKLIRFGKSAYCITMPRTWLSKNHINKGDTLVLQETFHNSIEVMPTGLSADNILELTVDISHKASAEISQLFLSAYLNGYTVITFLGSNAGKVAFIRKQVHELIAAEIMEVTSDRIIINIFWDIKTINLQSLITRICHINRSMFTEVIQLIDSSEPYGDIIEKGAEVQRQVLLAQRAITYALNNSAAARKFELSSMELIGISYVTYFYGKLGDYLLKLARIVGDSRINSGSGPLKCRPGKVVDLSSAECISCNENYMTELKTILIKVSDYFNKVLEIHHKRSGVSKFVFSEYSHLEEDIEKFRVHNPQIWVQLIAEYVHSIMLKIKESEFAMITVETAPK